VSIYAPEGGAIGAETVAEGDRLEIGAFIVEVYSTPGHTVAHNSYLVSLKESGTKPFLVAGDTIFAGSIAAGLSDRSQLMREVRRLWETLPGDTVVAPGHGPLTSIETEREFNPFSV
jgi:hydroxyacylglutathione hydrolase